MFPDVNMTGIDKLRVLFPREFPAVAWNCTKFPTLVPSRQCPFPGLLVEIIKVIADTLNATIEPHAIFDSGNKDEKLYIGRIGKKRIDGMMGLVFDDEVDTIAYPLQRTIIRHAQFDFSTELYEVESNHARYQDTLNSLWTFFTVYDRASWSVMGACLFLQTLFYIAQKFCFYVNKGITRRDLSDAIWTAVQLHLGQALNMNWKSIAVSFNLIIVWIFQVIILLGVYSSYSLSQKLKNDGISNIDGPKELIEVLESGERHFVSTTASDWFYESLNRSDAYPYKSLRRATKRNPIYLAETEVEVLERASAKGGLAVVSQDHPLSILAKEYCNLVPMDDPLALVSTHLIFRKDSPLVAPVNEAISLNRMVILRIFRKYMDYQKRIDNPACHKLQAPIDMPVYGLSLVYLALIALSIVCFTAEVVVWTLWDRPREAPRLPILFRRTSMKPTNANK